MAAAAPAPDMLEVAVRQRLGAFLLDVAFTAPGDGLTMLFGPSGAGKSSTLAAIGGTVPAAGRIALDGRVLLDSVRGIRVPPHRRRIGWVHQDARLFPHLPVAANLRYGLRRATGAPPRIGFDAVVEMLGIGALLGRRVAELSGGERQRVALGRALLGQPALLLLDEPLAALDDARKREIIGFIARLKAELRLPMLYVTHDMAEVRALADHVVHLACGRVVAAPDPAPPATIEALVVAPDPAGGWRAVTTDGREIALPALDCRPGDRVRIGITRDDERR